VCAHPARLEIDATLAAGEAFRGIARRFAVSPDAVERHAKAHLPAAMTRASEAAAVAHGDDLLAQVRELQGRALGILDKAEGCGKLTAALGAIREARGCIELLGKLAGALNDGTTVNVLVSVEWHSTRRTLLAALAPFPEARIAAAAALESIGDAGA
jgi:hypothetical protein